MFLMWISVMEVNGLAKLWSFKNSHRKHSRSILEGIRQAWHAGVVWQARIAVARRQRRVEEGLLCGVMCLGLVLLCLS